MIGGTTLFLSLFSNLAIFIVLTAVYGFVNSRMERSYFPARPILMGIIFGFFAFVCMHARIPVHPGVIVDQRNAIVALSGAFGGPLSGLISAILAGSYRAYLGGSGVFGGIVGVSLSAAAGTIFYLLRHRISTIPSGFVASLAATIIVIPGFIFIGDLRAGFELMKAMALPYGSAIFIGIFFTGLLLVHQERSHLMKKELMNSEKRYQDLFDKAPVGYIVTDNSDEGPNIKEANETFLEMLGYSRHELMDTPVSRHYTEESKKQMEGGAYKKALRGIFLKEERDLVTRDGRIVNTLMHVHPRYDNDGVLTGTRVM